jgi:hypothetical protein
MEGRTRSLSHPIYHVVLRWSERLAAFQAAGLVSWGNQSAKRAHPLASKVSVLWLERRKQLREPISELPT